MTREYEAPEVPRDKPFYIDDKCPYCGTLLVLWDLHRDPNTPEEEIWYDEWVCPCDDRAVYLDGPQQFSDVFEDIHDD